MQTFVVELRDLGTFQAMGLNRSGSLAVLARQDGIAAARLGEVDFTQSKEEVEAAAAASVERINHRFFNVHAFIAEMQFHCEKESLCAIGLANRVRIVLLDHVVVLKPCVFTLNYTLDNSVNSTTSARAGV